MKILIIFTSLLFLYFPICFAQNEVLNNFPDSIYSGKQSRFHVQGIAIDKRNGFVYFSFTDRLIKTDLSGKILGSVTGIVGHLGDLAFNEETEEVRSEERRVGKECGFWWWQCDVRDNKCVVGLDMFELTRGEWLCCG